MKNGEIIDIVNCDGNGKLTLRRVQVSKVQRTSGGFSCTGKNLKGKYPKQYQLPASPIVGEIIRRPNLSGWSRFNPAEEAE